MKCEGCLPLLEEYADGELDAGAAARVEAHLEDCAACAREHRKLEAERAVFLAYECDAAPAEGFWDDVLSKIDAATDAHTASARPASLPARARLAAALGVFAAPRLSPALTAALLLVAVALTVALMKYAAPRDASPARETAEATAPRKADEGAAPSSPSPSSSSNQGGTVAPDGAARGADERARDVNE